MIKFRENQPGDFRGDSIRRSDQRILCANMVVTNRKNFIFVTTNLKGYIDRKIRIITPFGVGEDAITISDRETKCSSSLQPYWQRDRNYCFWTY